MVVIYKSQKAIYLGNCFWNRLFLNSNYLFLLYTIFGNNMSQIGNSWLEKFTFAHHLRCISPKHDSIRHLKCDWCIGQTKSPMVKAVRGLLASVSSTCQYPDCKSRLVKIVAPSKQSKDSSILGRLCASLIVRLLSFLKSIQNLQTTIFLADQYYWTCPRASRLLYSPYVQHFL